MKIPVTFVVTTEIDVNDAFTGAAAETIARGRVIDQLSRAFVGRSAYEAPWQVTIDGAPPLSLTVAGNER